VYRQNASFTGAYCFFQHGTYGNYEAVLHFSSIVKSAMRPEAFEALAR